MKTFLQIIGVYAWGMIIGCFVPVLLIVGAVKIFVWLQAAAQ